MRRATNVIHVAPEDGITDLSMLEPVAEFGTLIKDRNAKNKEESEQRRALPGYYGYYSKSYKSKSHKSKSAKGYYGYYSKSYKSKSHKSKSAKSYDYYGYYSKSHKKSKYEKHHKSKSHKKHKSSKYTKYMDELEDSIFYVDMSMSLSM